MTPLCTQRSSWSMHVNQKTYQILHTMHKHAALVREQYILCTYALWIWDARYIVNWGLLMDGIITEFDSFISSCLYIYIYIDSAICIVELLQNEKNSSEIYLYNKWSIPSLKEKNFIWWGIARCFSELFCSFLWWQPNFLIFISGQCKYCYIICSIISTPIIESLIVV